MLKTPRQDGKAPVVYLQGPSGSGKSTLKKLGHTAGEAKVPVFVIAVCGTVNSDLESCPCCVDSFILIDDAQKLTDYKDVITFIQRRGTAVCLAFSPVIVEARGAATSNCPLQATKVFYGTPFTDQEIRAYKLLQSQNAALIDA